LGLEKNRSQNLRAREPSASFPWPVSLAGSDNKPTVSKPQTEKERNVPTWFFRSTDTLFSFTTASGSSSLRASIKVPPACLFVVAPCFFCESTCCPVLGKALRQSLNLQTSRCSHDFLHRKKREKKEKGKIEERTSPQLQSLHLPRAGPSLRCSSSL
jgi:hypothetical protein